jgi:hypothetical protein
MPEDYVLRKYGLEINLYVKFCFCEIIKKMEKKLKVALLGGGSWGTTVASLTARNSPTTMWARDVQTVEDINKHHRNEKYLPNALCTRR